MEYEAFIDRRRHYRGPMGFAPVFMPGYLKEFQAHIVDWALRRGRSGVFADCGLGKTAIQLVWAQNVVEKTNGRVLILTPLAVGAQTIRESEKWGIPAHRVHKGELPGDILITNYERLKYYDPADFTGCVCDESSILKNFKGKYKAEITKFMRKMRYRLLCTATAAPNDYIELGTSSEALGEMGFTDMLGKFFKNDTNPTIATKSRFARQGSAVPKWRFKWHADIPFWRWVSSWATAVRKPSDLGYPNDGYDLPPLHVCDHIIDPGADTPLAVTLTEQRKERRNTLAARCDMAAEIAKGESSSILWCHLNDEGDALEKRLGPDCVQVCGSQSENVKEEKLLAFMSGEAKYLVTKPMCAGFGLNMQHCAHMTFFPSHSYEQYYQSVRRCWRFGQENPVTVDIVTSTGEANVKANLQKKADAADEMFSKLVACMNDAEWIKAKDEYTNREEMPQWL